MLNPVWGSVLAAALLPGAGGEVPLATTAVPRASPEPQTAADEEGEPVYAAPTRHDRIGRIMAPVFVNGRGPHSFIIDTGASRSAIAPRLVARLGLVPDTARRLILSGVTGTEEVPSILVERLEAGDVVIRNQYLPVVAPQVFANSDGILGIDGFAGMCLHADFRKDRIAITTKGCQAIQRGWVRIRATLHPERLVQVSATIRGRPVQAIIDTGAERSLGNLALLSSLSLERRAEDPRSDTEVIGATSHTVDGNLLVIPTLYLGRIGIGNMRVAFGDFNVFKLWNLANEPAIIVGMDVLGTVDALMIDYARVELRILPRQSSGPPTIRHDVGASSIRR